MELTLTEELRAEKDIKRITGIVLCDSLEHFIDEMNYPADIIINAITEYVEEKVDELTNEKEHEENVKRAKEMLDELCHFCDKNNIVMQDKCTEREIFEIDVY
jgi:hypothetical protein